MARCPHPLSDQERLDWLRLWRSEQIGPMTFFQLLRFYGSAATAIERLPELARRSGRIKPMRLCARDEAEREIARLSKLGARLIAWIEPDYPEPLAAIEDAPPLLACRGDPALLARPVVAIVGSRNASTNGCKIAQQLARDLGEADFVVASGLARGIDTAAHRGALPTGTAAALAGGIDICYPQENVKLFDEIGERGALLSEQPLATEPMARHFPRRNRIISGLARGVVVVEAALRSGSLITARLALEQGREVLAVPGSPLDARCHGSNDLLRQGAVLVESADDVIRALAPMIASRPIAVAESEAPAATPAAEPDEAARTALLERLSPSPTAIDDLVRDADLPPALVAIALLELELAGRVERHPGNRVARLGA